MTSFKVQIQQILDIAVPEEGTPRSIADRLVDALEGLKEYIKMNIHAGAGTVAGIIKSHYPDVDFLIASTGVAHNTPNFSALVDSADVLAKAVTDSVQM